MVIGFPGNWEVQRDFLFIEEKFIPDIGKDLRLGGIGIRIHFSPADCLMSRLLERNAAPPPRKAA